jgi:hypothetical protein
MATFDARFTTRCGLPDATALMLLLMRAAR